MKTLIVGGAGFIGSHFADRLLSEEGEEVWLYDNFSSGREWHYEQHLENRWFKLVRGHVEDLPRLIDAMSGANRVIHVASNPDIARAMSDPTIDFHQGTALTSNVLEAARISGVKEILYASGSGVYGDIGEVEAQEDRGPLCPTSPYGASKLAGEAMLSAYSSMFGIQASAFRFGNVVGPRQTHGVGFDFVRRLRRNPAELDILGDGRQSKSYVHVSDVVSAVLRMSSTRQEDYEVFNVATGDYITVSQIAEIAIAVLGLELERVNLKYTGGDRGWKGDVPVVRLDVHRIRERGWSCALTSSDALRSAMESMVHDDELGRL